MIKRFVLNVMVLLNFFLRGFINDLHLAAFSSSSGGSKISPFSTPGANTSVDQYTELTDVRGSVDTGKDIEPPFTKNISKTDLKAGMDPRGRSKGPPPLGPKGLPRGRNGAPKNRRSDPLPQDATICRPLGEKCALQAANCRPLRLFAPLPYRNPRSVTA